MPREGRREGGHPEGVGQAAAPDHVDGSSALESEQPASPDAEPTARHSRQLRSSARGARLCPAAVATLREPCGRVRL